MKTLIVGFDAFDPGLFEDLRDKGRLPNLARLASAGQYRRFEVANPPQSEVSWTSIATGLNPGGHGIFDFVHRNPANYGLQVSLLQTRKGPFGPQFVPPHNAYTLFEQAVDDGYPASSMWWPATFPARLESPVNTFPGLGAPDIQGRLGVGTNFTTAPDRPDEDLKTPWAELKPAGSGRFTGDLSGPATKKGPATIPVQLELLSDSQARLALGKQHRLDLQVGHWSPVVELTYKLAFLVSVKVVTRFIVTKAGPAPRLYALPLQPHPRKAPWPFAASPGFAKKTWEQHGPFLTGGWPQDTTALEEGLIDDDQFLALCDSIFEARRKIYLSQVNDFREGVAAAVFDTLDRVQHMFWHNRPDVIESWYLKLDRLAGEVLEKAPSGVRVLFLSDHGFARFDHKVHINAWLADRGYLVTKDPAERSFRAVDWSKTKAYALGLNAMYLNQAGREGQGQVSPDEREGMLAKIAGELLEWKHDGKAVFQQVKTQAEAFEGGLSAHGPDLVLGYAPGFRASQETGLGGWGERAVLPNTDHWGADHCMSPAVVPGVLFANQGLENFENPSYRDFPALALGKPLDKKEQQTELPSDGEDSDAVEERLKGLGYL